MKAWGINKYGDNSQLHLIEVPIPEPGFDEVQIRMKAASINPVDFKLRSGKLKLFRRYQFPLILGHDGAGVISKVGAKVTKFKVGDEVFVRFNKERVGSMAEYAVANQATVAMKPRNISFEEAASIPLVGLTSWQVLLERAQMKAGDRVFIPAGSGGIGTFAVQLAKNFGAHVVSNTSGKNIEMVKKLGASEVVNYQTDDFSKVTAPVDIVYDTMGGETQKKAFDILKPGGRVVSIVGPPTKEIAEEWGLPWWAKLGIGVMSAGAQRRAKARGGFYHFHFMHPDGATLQKIADLIDQGKIVPVLDKVFPFSEGNEAMAYVEKGHSRGKVVVKID